MQTDVAPAHDLRIGGVDEELADLVEGIEGLLDAYAADAIDLCPPLERLLFDILDRLLGSRADAP